MKKRKPIQPKITHAKLAAAMDFMRRPENEELGRKIQTGEVMHLQKRMIFKIKDECPLDDAGVKWLKDASHVLNEAWRVSKGGDKATDDQDAALINALGFFADCPVDPIMSDSLLIASSALRNLASHYERK